MKFRRSITVSLTLTILLILLMPTSLAVITQGPDNTGTSVIDNISDEASGKRTYEEYGHRGMEIVPASKGPEDDFNGNSIEDQFEPILSEYRSREIVEAIIQTEFFIDESFKSYLERSGAELVYVTHGLESAGIRIAKNDLLQLAKDPRVAKIYGNYEAKHMLSSSVPVVEADPTSLSSGGYSDIDGSGVTIVIIDTGIDGTHRTFPAGKIIAFKDYQGGRDDLDPTDGMTTYDSSQQPHGTMTASCAAGTGGGTGYAGSAPGAYLIVIRVGGSAFDISQAVQWSINNRNKDFNKDGIPDGPDVISMSLGTSPSNYIDNQCLQAVSAGITFVTSAGNSGPGSSTMTSPARAKDILSIGAIHDNKNIWYYSSRGPGAGGITKPDVVAPGAGVTVAYPGNRWTTTSGTSFSAPITAGVVALMLQIKPELTPAEIMTILHDTSEDRGPNGPDNSYGWGVVDAVSALDSIPSIRKLMISQTDVKEDDELLFSAETSGKILKFEWDFDGDGTYDYSAYDSPDVYHSYTKSGLYQAELRITDSKSQTQSSKQPITVKNVKPTIDVEYSGAFGNEDEPMIFNVSKTDDTPTDKASLIYTWDFDDGTDPFETNATELVYTFSNEGVYNVKVTVRDDDDEIDEETIAITISNILPIANAGSNRVVREDDIVFFSGEDTFDTPSDEPSLNFTWDLDNGIQIHKRKFHYVYTESRKYTVSLLVRDDNGGESKAVIYVTVDNFKPEIAIKEEEIEVLEDEEFELHGIVNDTVSDIESLEFYWDFDDGTVLDWGSHNLAVKHTYRNRGIYNVIFKVKDDDGSVNSTSMEVIVDNVPPEADYTMNAVSIYEDESIFFDAGASTDTKSDLINLEYNWDFDDGSKGEGKTISHKFTRSGLFQVYLTVVDDNDEDSMISYLVTVNNIFPEAVITAEMTEAFVGDAINFSGKHSRDSPTDMLNLIYNWDFGYDDTSTSRDVRHTFTRPGVYEVILSVTDTDGGYNSVSTTITIKEIPEQKSTAGELFNLETTEGWLMLAAILIAVLAFVIISAFIVIQKREKKRKLAKRRTRKAVMKQRVAAPHHLNGMNGMHPQSQMMGYQAHAPPQPQIQSPFGAGSGLPFGAPGQNGLPGPAPAEQQPFPQLPPQRQPMVKLPEDDSQADVSLPPEQPDNIVEGIPILPPGHVFEGEVVNKPGPGTYCGTCGEPTKTHWFICPSCRNVL
jgi:PKD repeat protein/subtilisin family serine protease